MSDPSKRPVPAGVVLARRSGPGAVYAFVGLGLLILAVGVGVLLWRANRKTPESIHEAAQVLQADIDKAAVERRASEALLVNDKARASHQQLAKDCRQLRSHVEEFSRRFLAHHSRTVDLLQGDLGKRVAASEELVREFELLRDVLAPPPVDGGRLTALASEVEGRCVTAVNMRGSVAGPVRQDAEAVEEQLARVAAATESLVRAEDALGSLIRRAGDKEASPTKLVDALRLRREQQDASLRSRLKEEADRIAKKEAEERAKVLAEGLERKAAKGLEVLQEQLRQAEEREALRLRQAKEAHVQELAELKAAADAQLEKQRVEAAAEKVRFEREVERAERDSQRVREEMAAERISLRCTSPEVRDVLAPFLAQGYWQPTDQMDERIEKRPMSLSLLQGADALSPTAVGLGKLYEIAATGEDRERPRWRAYGTLITADHIKAAWFCDHPEALELAKRAQALLVELGPHLVERNLLAK